MTPLSLRIFVYSVPLPTYALLLHTGGYTNAVYEHLSKNGVPDET